MKVAVIVLADTETHADLARAVNAMVAVQEMKEADDDVVLIFDGAGTRWPGELAAEDHKAHKLWTSVEDTVAGACSYCAEAFEATHEVEDAGVKILDEYKHHPSIRGLRADGHQILTF
jgi:hypothetical protein